MKLRNKKTGEICELVGFNISNDSYKKKFGKKDYYSLQEFCEDWEDCKPSEPLIKDPKIRKAVRAWAEANAVVYIIRDDSESFADADGSICIDFDVDESVFNDVPFGRNLTIDELCGEEEE